MWSLKWPKAWPLLCVKTHAAGCASDNRDTGCGRLQRRDAKAFRRCRMHEQIETADKRVEIVPITGELYDIAKT